MPQFQKFQFDNFIIDDETALAVFEADKKETEEAEPEISVEPDVPEEREEPEEQEAEFEEISFEPEPVAAEVKTYTQEELDAQIKAAEERGKNNALQEAQQENEAKNTLLLNEIGNKLGVLISESETREKESENAVLGIVSEALHKLLPSLAKERAEEIVGSFLKENFPNFKTEPKLSFYFNAEAIGWVQEKIARLAATNDFEGKISLHKDNSLAPYDCRVEWENGGVERKMNKMLEKMDNLLEEAKHKN